MKILNIQLTLNEYKWFSEEVEGILEFFKLAEADFIQYQSNIKQTTL